MFTGCGNVVNAFLFRRERWFIDNSLFTNHFTRWMATQPVPESYHLVWLDAHIKESQPDTQHTLKQLRIVVQETSLRSLGPTTVSSFWRSKLQREPRSLHLVLLGGTLCRGFISGHKSMPSIYFATIPPYTHNGQLVGLKFEGCTTVLSPFVKHCTKPLDNPPKISHRSASSARVRTAMMAKIMRSISIG